MSEEKPSNKIWEFRLYINSQNPISDTVYKTVHSFLEMEAPGKYMLEVIDVFAEPHRAEEDRILALPSLMRVKPEPIRTVIGNCANRERLGHILDRYNGPSK